MNTSLQIASGSSGALTVGGGADLVSADQREIVVRSNEVFRADMDGVFMGFGRYQRYRQAVADKIQEAQKQ